MRERLSDAGLTLLRVGMAVLMLRHGIDKLLHIEELRLSFPDPLGIGVETSVLLVVGAEVGCAVLLALGLFTRLAAIPLAFTMGVAVYMHLSQGDSFDRIELPLLYAIAFLTIVFTGPGAPSVDRKMDQQVALMRDPIDE